VAEADIEFRTIEGLAALVGSYCWAEHAVFELVGSWATAPEVASAPEVRVWCAAVSRRHGDLAARWATHLPVRAGVDPGALVTAPSGGLAVALGGLGGDGSVRVDLVALVEVVLPGLVEAYERHLATASPVSEGPVMELLVEARRAGLGEIESGRTVVRELARRT
jgi:hypothetical protein